MLMDIQKMNITKKARMRIANQILKNALRSVESLGFNAEISIWRGLSGSEYSIDLFEFSESRNCFSKRIKAKEEE